MCHHKPKDRLQDYLIRCRWEVIVDSQAVTSLVFAKVAVVPLQSR